MRVTFKAGEGLGPIHQEELVPHEVTFIDDDALPEGHDWALAEVDGDVYFVVKRSRVCPHVLEEGWAAFLYLLQSRPTLIPAPRSMSGGGRSLRTSA